MYHAFYLYRVPTEHVGRFLRIVGEASAVYRRHGAPGSVTLRLTEGAGKFGCLGLADQFQTGAEEQIFVGIDSFRDAEQFRTLGPQIDSDPLIGKLFEEIQNVIDLGKVIRWEAEDVA